MIVREKKKILTSFKTHFDLSYSVYQYTHIEVSIHAYLTLGCIYACVCVHSNKNCFLLKL